VVTSLLFFFESTLLASACEGSMLHNGQENPSRQLITINRRSFEGWSCSNCEWIFRPSGPPVGKSLDEMKQNYQRQLSQEFAAHACSNHKRAKVASRSS
jgi:rubredoxin